jgi:hypothetical protein
MQLRAIPAMHQILTQNIGVDCAGESLVPNGHSQETMIENRLFPANKAVPYYETKISPNNILLSSQIAMKPVA